MLDRLRMWLRAVLHRRRLEREMGEEMDAHVRRSTERLMARGMTADDARRAALREFGNVGYLQEQSRDARGARWIESISADLRFGMRHFARTPLATVAMIVLLAIGIGIDTALFTFLH